MLNNKLGITDRDELADVEERIVKLKVRDMYDSGRLGTIPVGTYASLAEIHKTLFCDLYDFAGEFREVNIYKGDFMFAPVDGLKNAVKFAEIMPQDSFDDIVRKYIAMNTAHPFRAGNGRALRLWLDVMVAASMGILIDWTAIEKNAYLTAMDHCALDEGGLMALLRPALSRDVSRSAFLRSVDASFAFEGYNRYKTEEL